MGKKIITIILIAFVAVSIFYLVTKEAKNTTSKTVVEDTNPASLKKDLKADTYVLYYFHGDKRCPTCIKIEILTDKIVKANFADELESGKLEWKVVNVGKKENAHYVDDFKFEFQSLIIVGYKDGKRVNWENLSKIWELVYNEEAFKEYVISEIDGFVGENK